MDTVLIDGVIYTKASVLAKKHKYTSDYIGQLARADKVDAELVGRSWYLTEGSLLEHKNSRHKTSEKANKKAVSRTKDIAKKSEKQSTRQVTKEANSDYTYEDKRQVLVYPNISKKSFRAREINNKQAEEILSTFDRGQQSKYESDQTDLYPVPQIFADEVNLKDSKEADKIASIAATWAKSEELSQSEQVSDDKINSITAVEAEWEDTDKVSVIKIKDQTSPGLQKSPNVLEVDEPLVSDIPEDFIDDEEEEEMLVPLPRLANSGRRDLTIKNLDNSAEVSTADEEFQGAALRPVIPKRPGVLKKIAVTRVVNDIEPKVGLSKLVANNKVNKNTNKKQINHQALSGSGLPKDNRSKNPTVIRTGKVNNPFTPKSVKEKKIKPVKKTSSALPWLFLILALVTCFFLFTVDLQVVHDGERLRQTLVFNPQHLFDLIMRNF